MAFLISGCDRDDTYHAIGERALSEATKLVTAFPQREAGRHSKDVAVWLSARLPRGATIQFFDTSQGRMANVIQMTEQPVAILATHYDTKTGIPDFVGANDGASTTGLLLALAQLTDLPVVYLFLDGEECRERYTATDGLHGSWYFAKHRNDLKHLPVIVLDMLGDGHFNPGLAENATRQLNQRLAAVAKSMKLPLLNAGEVIDD
ncbi:MAG: M28 family peptidase, partial [Kiritimatiellae bacterium]|nr:M28 family peptidase [Kiritimatiellia bacterium]